MNGLVVRATDSEFRGRAFSLNQTVNQLGGMLGPLIGGAISGVLHDGDRFLVAVPYEVKFRIGGAVLTPDNGLRYTEETRTMTRGTGTCDR
ncbi:permease [Paenibacillus popilliae ATCC 14706]|uniref:Permease n=1 Tax=Paenibacillus popilliae ATCC 14706 TaxID=1212764 RepID=M9M295_PAEPP|nr:permease [Paenibacillus popilliae ATCC 14706]